MYHSLCATTSIVFMTICPLKTTSMNLNEHLDTALRLGTSTPGNIAKSNLDEIGLLESKRAAELGSLDLSLAPPSGTTKKMVPSKQNQLSSALGIQKTHIFKNPFQEKQHSRISSDVEMWLKDQNVQDQITEPASHLLGIKHSIMPYDNLMFEASSSSFPAHNPQDSGSRNLQIHGVPTHNLPRLGSGSNSLQGFPTRDQSAENFANNLESHPIQMSRASQEKGVSGKFRSGYEESLPSGGTKEALIVPKRRKFYRVIPRNMPKLSTLGKDELWVFDRMRGEIATWFDNLEAFLKERIHQDRIIRIKPIDIRRALGFAHLKLTAAFFGFLVSHYEIKGKSNEELLRQGWEYMKSYMIQWKVVDLEAVVDLQHIQVDDGVRSWTPTHTLAYLMWVDGRITLSSEVLSKHFSKFTLAMSYSEKSLSPPSRPRVTEKPLYLLLVSNVSDTYTSYGAMRCEDTVSGHHARMYPSLILWLTTSIVFMTISTVLATPMNLNGDLDTALRLGTSEPGTIAISKLDKIDSLELTLAPAMSSSDSSPAPEIDPLDLTLAPSSGIATKIVSPGKLRLSGALGIQKIDPFKQSARQRQYLRITPDFEMWLEHQNSQLTKPASQMRGSHHNIISNNNPMYQALPSTFSGQDLQDTDSRYLQTHEVSAHSLSTLHASASNSVQGPSTREPAAEHFANLMQYQHHSIIEPPTFESHPVQMSRVPEENVISETFRIGVDASPPPRGEHVAFIAPASRRSYIALHNNMPRLHNSGRQELWIRPKLRAKIAKWFDDMKSILIARIQEKQMIGITPDDIKRALSFAQSKLTTAFLAFLLQNYDHIERQGNQDIIRGGWDYLESSMAEFQYVNLDVVLNLKYYKEARGYWESNPDQILAYLMWKDGRNTFSSVILSRFLYGWEKLNGLKFPLPTK
ncbi:uncharacterized protein MELLADRAFT_102318 [Melampsora larici-populina 98AG31]|uniref:Uncharacterized protein n=1 Tax=Melampsora larici-populina (strain 98AG31 / pathotype 3-4-7) TaxID=747676 RepID=F4R7W7_MELLP|nr:uncharacterized protein MELLADRAFT_102318 [Melampsora larici-populina 98AG31]EGG11390.1 hypothetical protein MELLADRAFT_102318 [Melampsora larici-populina 98AG31]